MLRKVVASKRVSKATGQPTESDNKWPATYILAQIHHSLGQVEDAIRQYRMVEDRYVDAKKSIDYFLRKEVRLPEVTTVRPGNPVEVELEYRNVTSCDLKIYRIDLMKFALLRQSLAGISRINLAGIEPHQEVAVELGNGKDYRARTHKLHFDLKDDGAYLIVCRAGGSFASGLVLLTPLEIEIQLDPASREVCATVKDVATGRYIRQADVKVISIGNMNIVSGQTDQRGLFVAQGIVGSPTVIAQADAGKYAFYRHATATTAVLRQPTYLLSAEIPPPAREMIAAAQRASEQSNRSVGVVLTGSNALEQRIEAVLYMPTSLSFHEAPIQDVAQVIQRRHEIPVQIDRRALDDVGLGRTHPSLLKPNT